VPNFEVGDIVVYHPDPPPPPSQDPPPLQGFKVKITKINLDYIEPSKPPRKTYNAVFINDSGVPNEDRLFFNVNPTLLFNLRTRGGKEKEPNRDSDYEDVFPMSREKAMVKGIPQIATKSSESSSMFEIIEKLLLPEDLGGFREEYFIEFRNNYYLLLHLPTRHEINNSNFDHYPPEIKTIVKNLVSEYRPKKQIVPKYITAGITVGEIPAFETPFLQPGLSVSGGKRYTKRRSRQYTRNKKYRKSFIKKRTRHIYYKKRKTKRHSRRN
jgi:hypothetical protein